MQILDVKDVSLMTNLSRVTIWRLENEGKFPQRIKISTKRIGWLEDEVTKWIEKRPRVVSESEVKS
jgi:prophage regulatory protein